MSWPRGPLALVVSMRSASPVFMTGTSVLIFALPPLTSCHQLATKEPAGWDDGLTVPESTKRGKPGSGTRTCNELSSVS